MCFTWHQSLHYTQPKKTSSKRLVCDGCPSFVCLDGMCNILCWSCCQFFRPDPGLKTRAAQLAMPSDVHELACVAKALHTHTHRNTHAQQLVNNCPVEACHPAEFKLGPLGREVNLKPGESNLEPFLGEVDARKASFGSHRGP